MKKLGLKVELIGIINDEKFTTKGSGTIDPSTGKASLQLDYSSCPKNWTPLQYSDPLILLAGYREEGGANFARLGSGFKAACTFDFGGGQILRKTATITVHEEHIDAVYSISGTASVGHITEMLPFTEVS